MHLRSISFASLAVLLTAVLFSPTPAHAATCESLAALALPDSTITMAQSVAAGAFSLPATGRGAAQRNAAFKELPAFCRVAATLKPSSDSDIKIEVWLPASNWNGKFQAVGNGGWAGTISYPAMAQALVRGYATSSTDTGHSTPGGSFALGHPEKLIDFGYRSEHEMSVKAKSIIAAFYGNGPRLSYWNGCSTGGRQGLREAQSYANDFDGIIAGAPANPRTRLAGWGIYAAQAVLKEKASYIPTSKYPMIHQAVVGACDANDGLKDGLIDDPTRCKFDFKTIECKGEDTASCLTAPQVVAAKKLTSPAMNSKTGELIYPGFSLGAELGWGIQAAGPEPGANGFDQYKYVVFKDPNWDWRTFNLDTDVGLADKIDNGTINAINPDLGAFQKHGGKLLMYHGWSDPNVPPESTINYYKSVLDKMGSGPKSSEWLRLFMVPGMGHCGGGEGPNTFDMVTMLEEWVEKGKAPEQIVATRRTNGQVDRTRPLCPYPQTAKYKGTGSTDDAANFVCR
ncbi:MAG TPA: tannase/feruloyl esterase family alpha/beta hydrolase [Terriglobia bacterium]|nr:tannase/feruloyl esterase family alpha/beta hydrolase [Terriglobia bacterium]